MESNIVAYSIDDMKDLAEQGKRLNNGDLFLSFLKDAGFKAVEKDTFYGKDLNEIIRISSTAEGIKFVNNNHEEDCGDFIQFLQNRMLEAGKIIPNRKPDIFFNAVSFALRYEKAAEESRPKMSVKRRKSKKKGRGI